MSTDLKTPPPASPESLKPEKPKFELSLAQVLGGALAAMTAAYLGSRLSMAGTVVGAALASIVAAVAGTVYTHSLRTTQAKVRTVFQGRVAGTEMPASVAEVPTASPAPAALVAPSRSRLSMRSMVLGALATFALAGAVLTGIELATGQALSGEDGTTITQVTEERATTPRRDKEPAPTADTPSPSASASDSPAPTPTEQESTSPSSAPTPSDPAAPPVPSASDNAPSSDTVTPSAPTTPSASAETTAPAEDD